MGKIILYGGEGSPPVRTVLLTLNALGLDYELRQVDMANKEHLSEEFLKKNPQHTIPVLDDNGHFLWDSHAISIFLVRKYAKNDALYPKDLYQRAIVDQRLHFESGVVFTAFRNIVWPIFYKNETEISQEKIDTVVEALNFLDTFLEHDYVAGNTLTIADFSLLSTVTSLKGLVPLDFAKFPKVGAWVHRLIKLPYYEKANGKGVVAFTEIIKTTLGTN